jgi:hypothetical protein
MEPTEFRNVGLYTSDAGEIPKRILTTRKTIIKTKQQISDKDMKINSSGISWCDVWQWRTQKFYSGVGGSTNSVEDRGQRERGSRGGSP